MSVDRKYPWTVYGRSKSKTWQRAIVVRTKAEADDQAAGHMLYPLLGQEAWRETVVYPTYKGRPKDDVAPDWVRVNV